MAGCASIDGTYSPNCAAYEGDTIRLGAGRFTWDRFTDAIPVDAAGNPVDPTPGYPVSGEYSELDGILSLKADSADLPESLYIRRRNGRNYLLTEEQVEYVDSAGEIPECALVLGGFDESQ